MRLAEEGHQIVAFGHRSPPEFSPLTVVSEILDVTSNDEVVAEIIARVVDRVGLIDVWVNNAGADILTPPLSQACYWEKWQALVDTDVTGTLRCCRALPPFMAPNGQIINMAWDHFLSGWGGDEGELYAAAKAAIVGYSRSLARSFRAEAIPLRVNIVAPGWVRTKWAESIDSESTARIASETFSGQWISPLDVAAMVHAMVGMPPHVANGHIFWVNGGDVMG